MIQSAPVRADIVVRGADGAIVALVEVKNREGLTADIARQIREMLFTNGLVQSLSPYFLMISQNDGFLWDQRRQDSAFDAAPTSSFSMRPVMAWLFPSSSSTDHLHESALERAVATWLSFLIHRLPRTPLAEELALHDLIQSASGESINAEDRY